MMPIRWSQRAVDDLQNIHTFIARDSEIYALRVVQELIKAVEQLVEHPNSGRLVPERSAADLRELIRPPYRIVYRQAKDQIQIITVFHSSRVLRLE